MVQGFMREEGGGSSRCCSRGPGDREAPPGAQARVLAGSPVATTGTQEKSPPAGSDQNASLPRSPHRQTALAHLATLTRRSHLRSQVEKVVVSPNQKLLAWSEDTVGGEKFTIHVKVGSSRPRALGTRGTATGVGAAANAQG
jgi:hypothetical protein